MEVVQVSSSESITSFTSSDIDAFENFKSQEIAEIDLTKDIIPKGILKINSHNVPIGLYETAAGNFIFSRSIFVSTIAYIHAKNFKQFIQHFHLSCENVDHSKPFIECLKKSIDEVKDKISIEKIITDDGACIARGDLLEEKYLSIWQTCLGHAPLRVFKKVYEDKIIHFGSGKKTLKACMDSFSNEFNFIKYETIFTSESRSIKNKFKAIKIMMDTINDQIDIQTEGIQELLEILQVLSGLVALYLMITQDGGEMDQQKFNTLKTLTENLDKFINPDDSNRYSLSTDFANIRKALLYYIYLHENEEVNLYQNLTVFSNLCCYCVMSEARNCKDIQSFMKLLLERAIEGGIVVAQLDTRFIKSKIDLIKRPINLASLPIVMLSNHYEIATFNNFLKISTDEIKQQHADAYKKFEQIYNEYNTTNLNRKSKELLTAIFKLFYKSTGCKGDNDPINVCEFGSRVAKRSDVIQVKILGTLALIDEGETDWKVFAIDINDPVADQMEDIQDIEKFFPGLLRATVKWFKFYKVPDGKPENQFAFNAEARDAAFAKNIVTVTHTFWQRLNKKEVENPKISCSTVENTDSPFVISSDQAEEIFSKATEEGEIQSHLMKQSTSVIFFIFNRK
ncbi:hypothetical protein PVAND_001266 [Polypedilum vanderplanki]|uniref:inorganic diphosphatase n=1 Tax=Polypedilum vanderplanki TaxID=319348 RepID=A0A9J6BMU9_POLVA|nr:hypothetical protein PVAND_001266 [Polypedilum vanderplanki]